MSHGQGHGREAVASSSSSSSSSFSSSSSSSSSSALYSMKILHSGDPVSRPRSWENPGTSSSLSLPSSCSTFIAAMYSYSYSVSISHACSGIFSRGIFRDMTTKAYLMALRTDQKWSRVLGPGVVECKRPLPEEPSAPISHTDPPYIASAITLVVRLSAVIIGD